MYLEYICAYTHICTAINEKEAMEFERTRRGTWKGLEGGRGRGNVIIV